VCPARAAAPTAAGGLNYLLPVAVEGTKEEAAPDGMISPTACYRDWPVGEFAVESLRLNG
jgi:hypothetical protein